MFTQQACSIDFGVVAILQRTFQNMRQEEPSALEVRVNRLDGPSRKGNPYRPKQLRRFTKELTARTIEIVSIFQRSNRCEQKDLNVHRPVPRRPFQPSQPPGYMIG